MIKKQLKLIIILLAAVVVLLAGYFIAKPYVFDVQEAEKVLVDKDGDTLGPGDRPYIYDVIPQENLKSIYVHNSHGEYRFNMDPVAKSLVLEGREILIFDEEALSYLYVNTCNMLAMAKVEDASQDLSEYGLPGGVSENYFVVTENDGTQHTVYIGSILPTGAAYYCKSADKPHIYVIDTMIERCVLADASVYVTPVIAPGIASENRYNIDNLRIVKNGGLFVSLEKNNDETALAGDGSAISHKMTYPTGYNVDQEVIDTILLKLSSFVGSGVVDIDVTTDEIGDVAEKYGFIKPSFEILYSYDGKDYRVVLGAKTEDRTEFYALNITQQTVCTVPVTDVVFLEYDLIKYIDKYIFQMNINSVETVEVRTRMQSETFKLSGEKETLSVMRASTSAPVDTKSFRQFYIDILLVNLEDYAQAPAEPHEVLAYTVTTKGGTKYDYRFYDLSTRRVFFTVNGVGQFYVNRDAVDRVISDFDKLLRGEEVISKALE